MFKKENIILLLGLLIPVLLIYKPFLFPGTAVWGDAPYFYPETLKELVSEPEVWTQRGTLLGGINNLLWISPLMFLYGVLNSTFGLNNDLLIRIIFYFPAIILAFLGSYLMVKSLGFLPVTRFFASLFYVFNTYFLLLIDGGQVGVALAYGLFPFSLWALRNFSTIGSINNFYLALLSIFILGVADPRFSIIALVTAFVWYLLEVIFKEVGANYTTVRKFLFLCVGYLLVSSYWLLPTFKLPLMGIETSDLAPVSILNSLLLYQPHWPLNEFGKISAPPFYFIGIPLIIFSNLFFKTRKILIILLVFLVFAYLTKGIADPAGIFYSWVLNNVPFSQAFRDSTKFFTPLALFAGILIANFASCVFDLLKKKPVVAYGSLVIIWGYLLFLLHPAFLGLNGVLSPKYNSPELMEIHELISKDDNFSRSVWFPEKHPFAFQSNNHPAIDAKELANLRPFAALNTGTLDRYNFLHDPASTDWLKVFGLKYLVLSGDFRKTQNEGEAEDWNSLIRLLESKKELKRQGALPLWEVEGALPHSYVVDKLIAVVGAGDIYEKMGEKVQGFDLGKQGFVFFEDGKLDPNNLQGIASESAILLLNDKNEEDLALSFLQKYFLGTEDVSGNWAIRSNADYLKWKYELLNHGIKTREFDYSRGIVFSSQEAEIIKFKTNLVSAGQYVLAVRSMGSGNGELRSKVGSEIFKINSKSEDKFTWFVKEGLEFPGGALEIELENTRGFQVVNVVALIPKQEWEKAWETSRRFTSYFKVISVSQNSWSEDPSASLNNNIQEVKRESAGTLKVKLTLPQDSWLILTDNWNPLWNLKMGRDTFDSLPIFSAVNGFYTERADKPILIFEGQKYFRWGLWLSMLSILSLAIYFLWSKSNEKSN